MSAWLICEHGHLIESSANAAVELCTTCGRPLKTASVEQIASISTAVAKSPSIDSTLDFGSSESVVQVSQPIQRVLGDYELLSELGRGGMGIIYQARQRTANRLVALKLIRRDRVLHDDRSLEIALTRFRMEAQAAARLRHDHIVTIFDVGQIDQYAFYSMQLIEGPSLNDLLREGALESRRAASYLEGVARAVETAHRSGVLHRDLKPANILVDARNDRALVTDFGLARIIAEGTDLTIAGQVFGSPPYMSPEQARDASQATPVSDVYSLGATLYACLTGRPPFFGPTTAETLRQVLDASPIPPSRLNPRIDRDLEMICLKCLEKNPAQRYSSAGALGDDLQRYLRHEPIVARPLGAIPQLIRWCRRKPAAALAITSLATLVIAVTAFLAIGSFRKAKSQQEAQFLTTQADTGFREALAAYDKLVFEVQEKLGESPASRLTRRELLETALAGMNKVMVEHSEATARLRAATLLRMGDISKELGQDEAAIQHFADATALLEREVAANQSGEQAQRDLSVACEKYGIALQRSGDAAAARKYFERCHALRSKLPQETRQSKRDMAIAHYGMARAEFALGQWNAAKQQMEQAIRWNRAAKSGQKADPDLQHDLGLYFSGLGDIELRRSDLQASEAAYRASVEATTGFADDTNNVPIRETLASSLRLLGDVQRAQQRWTDAQTSYLRAWELAQELQQTDPDAINVQWLVAITTHRAGLAEHHFSNGKSLARLQESVKLLTPLAARDPADAVKVGELVATHDFLASALSTNPDAAFGHQIAAQDLRAQRALQSSGSPQQRMDAGLGYVRIAATADSQARSAQALEGYRKAIAFFQLPDNLKLLESNSEYRQLLKDLPQAIAEIEKTIDTSELSSRRM